MKITIRRATTTDSETVLELIRGLADYEKLDRPNESACSRLIQDGFGPNPRFEAWLAEMDDVAVGYAILFETYSSFLAMPTLYLEDIFLRPDVRGKGIGKAFLLRLAREAVSRGCGRMEWVCLDWNKPSIGFYEKHGAKQMPEWVSFRLDEAGLKSLATMANSTD